MVNCLTHDENGRRLKKLSPDLMASPGKTKPARVKLVINPQQVKTAAVNPDHKLSREYDVLKELVRSDHQRLKNMDDADKIKREKSRLVNQYRDYLTQWINAGERHTNDVLFFNVVWTADIGEWDWLLKLTDYAVKTGQVNDIFKSEPQTIAAREIYYAADRAIEYHDDRATKSIDLIPQVFGVALEKVESGEWTIPKALKAKYFKIAGIACQFSGGHENLLKAQKYYIDAEMLDSKVGCKGRLKEVTELLNPQ